jgi:hypothetical protein
MIDKTRGRHGQPYILTFGISGAVVTLMLFALHRVSLHVSEHLSGCARNWSTWIMVATESTDV